MTVGSSLYTEGQAVAERLAECRRILSDARGSAEFGHCRWCGAVLEKARGQAARVDKEEGR